MKYHIGWKLTMTWLDITYAKKIANSLAACALSRHCEQCKQNSQASSDLVQSFLTVSGVGT